MGMTHSVSVSPPSYTLQCSLKFRCWKGFEIFEWKNCAVHLKTLDSWTIWKSLVSPSKIGKCWEFESVTFKNYLCLLDGTQLRNHGQSLFFWGGLMWFFLLSAPSWSSDPSPPFSLLPWKYFHCCPFPPPWTRMWRNLCNTWQHHRSVVWRSLVGSLSLSFWAW